MGESSWSPTEKLLYVAVLPVLAVVAAIVFIGLASSEEKHAARAQPTAAALARQAEEKARDAQRRAYQECLKSMGVNLGGTRVRSRFSQRPDMAKVREATAVCRVVLQGGGAPTPASRQPSAPQIT
jgi:hypothetical protein